MSFPIADSLQHGCIRSTLSISIHATTVTIANRALKAYRRFVFQRTEPGTTHKLFSRGSLLFASVGKIGRRNIYVDLRPLQLLKRCVPMARFALVLPPPAQIPEMDCGQHPGSTKYC